MACMSQLAPEQTLVQRMAETEKSLKRLEASLTSGRVRIAIGPTGAIAFQGWTDNDRIGDTCATRSLMATNSWAFRQALMKAEGASGRKMNQKAILAGVHSHDGGKTWSSH